MKTALNAMKTHLAGSTTTMCTMWKLKRVDGVKMGFTDHDRDLSIDIGDGDGSVTYKASTGYQRSSISSNSNFEVDSLEVNTFLDSTAITEADISAGKYDNATVTIFAVNHQDLSMGKIILRKGWAGALGRKGQTLVVELLGLLRAAETEILQTIQPLCNADFRDARCGATGLLIGGGVVQTVTNSRIFVAQAAGFGGDGAMPGKFVYGLIEWSSGTFNGLKHEIKAYVNATRTFTLFLPLPSLPGIGDTFSVRMGCNKTVQHCKDWSNIRRFRGFPNVPTLDNAYGIGHIDNLYPLDNPL